MQPIYIYRDDQIIEIHEELGFKRSGDKFLVELSEPIVSIDNTSSQWQELSAILDALLATDGE